ncbi:MAG: hypothetical protein WCC11_04580 [Gammaproteobacteria bacterium]
MKKIILLLAVVILCGMGWQLGKHFGLVSAWLLSSLGAVLGAYIGWRVGRAYFD